MKYKLISCAVFYREMCAVVARSKNMVDMEFLPKGLHDIGAKGMLGRLQEIVDAVDSEEYDAILMGYALCNNGLSGLAAKKIPIVVPCGHDCITLFLGSKERYREYFDSHAGVYFKTSGWIERADLTGELSQLSIQHQTGMDMSLDDLIAKYGEENARFLYEELCQTTRNYGQFTYIEMGVEPDDRFEEKTREDAISKGWSFEKIPGDLSLMQRLVDGEWDEENFVVINPGEMLAPSYNDRVILKMPNGG